MGRTVDVLGLPNDKLSFSFFSTTFSLPSHWALRVDSDWKPVIFKEA